MKAFISWIKQWALTAYEAVTNVAFYRRLESRKTSEAVGHLSMFAVVWTVPLSVMFFIGLRDVTARLAEGIRADIPQGTVFEMKGGKLTNNLQAPLIFGGGDAVVIINTATTTLDLQEGEDGIAVGSSQMVQQDGPKRQTLDYSKAPDFRLGREELLEKIARWAPFALFLGSLLVLIFMFLTFWAGFLLNALIHGFALWLLLKLLKRPRPWREAFVAASYAATAAIVLSLVLSGNGTLAPLPDIVYWGFIAWIAYDAYKGGHHERKETAPADRPRTEGQSGPV